MANAHMLAIELAKRSIQDCAIDLAGGLYTAGKFSCPNWRYCSGNSLAVSSLRNPARRAVSGADCQRTRL